MEVSYFYCGSCGYEDFNIQVGFIRTTANADWWECPLYGKETSYVEEGSDE